MALISLAPAARAQIAVEPYLGAYWFDDDALNIGFQTVEFDAGPILGARVTFPLGEWWGIGGGYGYASFTARFRVQVVDGGIVTVEDDATEHLYYGLLEFLPLRPDPMGFHLSGEFGGATYSPGRGAESISDLMAGFGAGLDARASERATIQLDLRDHLRFCSEAILHTQEGLCFGGEQKVLHNVELSAGARISF